MELKELEDYEAKEKEKTGRILQGYPEKEPLGFLNFLPEIKTQLAGKVYTNVLNIPGAVLFQSPFYDSVIFEVMPVKSQSLFESGFGISVDQLLELHKKGRVKIMLGHQPTAFGNLTYLDEILELRPPTIIRFAAYSSLVQSRLGYDPMKYAEWREFGAKIARDKGIDKNPTLQLDFRLTHMVAAGGPESLIEEFGINFAHLCQIGYEKLAKKLSENKDPVAAFLGLRGYSGLLYYRPRDALEGIQSWSNKDFQLARRIDLKENQVRRFFPVDIGKLLCRELKLIDVRDLGFEKIVDLFGSTSTVCQTLYDLERAVREKRTTVIQDRNKALQRVWNECMEAVQAMIRERNLIVKAIPIALGVVGGVIGSLAFLPGLIAGILGGGIGGLAVSEEMADRLVTVKRPSHLVSLYRIKTRARM